MYSQNELNDLVDEQLGTTPETEQITGLEQPNVGPYMSESVDDYYSVDGQPIAAETPTGLVRFDDAPEDESQLFDQPVAPPETPVLWESEPPAPLWTVLPV